jgi:hypothetical protein
MNKLDAKKGALENYGSFGGSLVSPNACHLFLSKTIFFKRGGVINEKFF